MDSVLMQRKTPQSFASIPVENNLNCFKSMMLVLVVINFGIFFLSIW